MRREVISLLEAELERVPEWQVHGSGFRAVRKGLHRTIRDARHAMREAQRTPTNSAWLRWRHHVKAHWFQVRLLAGRTGNGLVLLERRLEALDGFLGDHHDCALLERVLTREALVTREQTAACLRVLGRYRSELRRQARTLGAVVYRQKAARQVQAIEERWLALGRTRARPTPVRRRRPRAAAPSTAAASPPVPLHAA